MRFCWLVCGLLAAVQLTPSAAIQLPDTYGTVEISGEHYSFGTEVAASEDFVVVGTYNPGRFFVFTTDGQFLYELPVTVGGQTPDGILDLKGDRLLLGNIYDDNALLFDAATGELLRTYTGHGESMFGDAVAFCGDTGLMAVSSSSVGVVYLFDVESGNIVREVSAGNDSSFQSFADTIDCSDNYVVVGAPWDNVDGSGWGGGVFVFDLHGTELARIARDEGGGCGIAVAVWENYVAMSCFEHVYLMRAEEGFEAREVVTLDNYRTFEFGVTLDMDAGILAVVDPSAQPPTGAWGAIYTFDLATAQQREMLAYSADPALEEYMGRGGAICNGRVWAGLSGLGVDFENPVERKMVGYSLSAMKLADETLMLSAPTEDDDDDFYDQFATDDSMFGMSIAMSRLYIAVAAPGYEGRGAIAVYNSDRKLLHLLSPPNITMTTFGGVALDVIDDGLLVGIPQGEPSNAFLYSASTGQLLHHFVAPNAFDVSFAADVALCGDTGLAAIGAQDAVYVYNISTQPPTLAQVVLPNDGNEQYHGRFGEVISCDGLLLAVQANELGRITLHNLGGDANTDFQLIDLGAQSLGVAKPDAMELLNGRLAVTVTKPNPSVRIFDAVTLEQLADIVPVDLVDVDDILGVALDQDTLLVSTMSMSQFAGKAWLYDLSTLDGGISEGAMLLPQHYFFRLLYGFSVALGHGHAAVSNLLIPQSGVVHLFLDAYEYTCSELPSQPDTPLVDDLSTQSARVQWTSSKPTCHPISHYNVFVFVQGQGYVHWQTAEGTEAEITNLEPGTSYRIKVAAVDAHGGSILSPPSESFSTQNASYIRFDSSGQALAVYITEEFRLEVQQGVPCELADRFADPAVFGAGASCRFKTSDLMVVSLAPGATVQPFDLLNYTSSPTPQQQQQQLLTFEVEPPTSPRPVSGALKYPSLASFCDDIELDASSFTGTGAAVYGLTYRWEILQVDGLDANETEVINDFLTALLDDLPIIILPNGTFPPGSTVVLGLTVASEVFLDVSSEAVASFTVSGPPIPDISVSPKSTTISVSDALTVEVAVQYGNCFLESVGAGYHPQFVWSISGGPSSGSSSAGKVSPQVSTDTRSVKVPSFSLADTRSSLPYTIRASLTVPGGVLVSSSATVHVRPLQPVAVLAAGARSVPLTQGTFTIDASLSYDPTVCRAFENCNQHLAFAYDCSYADGSSCCQFASQNSAKMSLNLAAVVSCNPAGPSAELVTLFVQAQVTSVLTGLSGATTMQLDVIQSSAPATEELELEPILPRRFTGFAALTKRPATPPTWRVIRRSTSTTIATTQGETAIFDTRGWPSGEQLDLEASTGGSHVRTTFFTPSKPMEGSFVLRSRDRVYAVGESLPALTTGINFVATDFLDAEQSTTPLQYSFTDTISVFSAVTQQPFQVTLLLNQPSTSNQLAQVLLSPGQHNLRVSIQNEAKGKIEVTREAQAVPSYATPEELLALILSSGRTLLAARSNSVGAFAAALSWIADGVQDLCQQFGNSEPRLADAQSLLLSVWLEQADRAAQQSTTAIKGLQDLYLLTLPGLCISDIVQASAVFDESLRLFTSVTADKLPADSCAMAIQILSSVLSIPSMAAENMNELRLVLDYLDSILESYCGVSVFSYDASQPSASALTFLDVASMLRDLSASSVRAPRGTPLIVELNGLRVELDSATAAELADALQGDNEDEGDDDDDDAAGFWDVSSYRVSRNVLNFGPSNATGSATTEEEVGEEDNNDVGSEEEDVLLSDIFELNVRLASLPSFRFCNSIVGEVEDQNRCVTHRQGKPGVSGLSRPIVFTIPANLTSPGAFEYSCQFIDPETNTFSSEGCKVLSTSVDLVAGYANVTCACNHLTAFAVRQVAFTRLSDCEDLDAAWADAYDSLQYRIFVTIMSAAWLVLLGLIAYWLAKSVKAIKGVNASLVANVLFFPVCLLRLVYFGALQYVSYNGGNVACVEFGIDGSQTPFGQHTVPIVHDLPVPILLIAFTSVVLYWYELEKSLAGPLSKMLSSRYLSRPTLIIFLIIDVALLAGFIGANFALLGPDKAVETDAKAVARGMMVALSAVCAVECILFLYYGLSVVEAGGGRKKMKKVSKLMYSSCTMFLLVAALLCSFSVPGLIADARRAFRLYSVLLHVVEFVGTAFMVSSLTATKTREKSSKDQTFIDKFFSKLSHALGEYTTSTAELSRTPKNSSVASRLGAISGIMVTEPERDVELVNPQFHLDQQQQQQHPPQEGVGGSFKRRAAAELTRDSSSSSMGESDTSGIDWSTLDADSRSQGLRLSGLGSSSVEQIDPASSLERVDSGGLEQV